MNILKDLQSNTFLYNKLTSELLEEAIKEIYNKNLQPKVHTIFAGEIGYISFEIEMPNYPKEKKKLVKYHLDLYFKNTTKYHKLTDQLIIFKKENKIKKIIDMRDIINKTRNLRNQSLKLAKNTFYGV